MNTIETMKITYNLNTMNAAIGIFVFVLRPAQFLSDWHTDSRQHG